MARQSEIRERPRVKADDVRTGAYFVDLDTRRLYCVAAVNSTVRKDVKTMIAILEDALSLEHEPWIFPDLGNLHLVRAA